MLPFAHKKVPACGRHMTKGHRKTTSGTSLQHLCQAQYCVRFLAYRCAYLAFAVELFAGVSGFLANFVCRSSLVRVRASLFLIFVRCLPLVWVRNFPAVSAHRVLAAGEGFSAAPIHRRLPQVNGFRLPFAGRLFPLLLRNFALTRRLLPVVFVRRARLL